MPELKDVDSLSVRELNAAVAQELFGWRWFLSTHLADRKLIGLWPPERDGWVRSNWHAEWFEDVTGHESDYKRFVDWDRLGRKGKNGRDGIGVPHYSSSWDAMRLVVEEMDRRGFWCRMRSRFNPDDKAVAGFTPHDCTGWNGDPDHKTLDDSLPTAVARAALKAVRGMNDA